MLKIKYGYWQLACAKDVMVSSWKLVRKTKCPISKALRISWEKVKKFFKNISSSYKEYKYKLIINKKMYFLNLNTNDVDEVVNNCLEKISKIKGKQFIYKIANTFYKDYDKLISKFTKKGTLTFARNVFVDKIRN